ncbi:YecA family protein [Virgibacillus profundi]|nr:SEC-C metal-binding domain-containing protein [Virgibacillus profundi]
MEKVGRNDPCPCGSGKKYKKCHGASNVVEISPELYNAELERLHSGLFAFAIDEYQFEMEKVTAQYLQPSLQNDEERMNSYMAGLTAWIILYEPIMDGETIFDLFYKKQQKKIRHERVRKAFAAWSVQAPSVYEILSITKEKAIW